MVAGAGAAELFLADVITGLASAATLPHPLRPVALEVAHALTDVARGFASKDGPARSGHAVGAVCALNGAVPSPRGRVRVYGWDPVHERPVVALAYTCDAATGPLFAHTGAAAGVEGCSSGDESGSESESGEEGDTPPDLFGVVDVLTSRLMALETAFETACAVLRIEGTVTKPV